MSAASDMHYNILHIPTESEPKVTLPALEITQHTVQRGALSCGKRPLPSGTKYIEIWHHTASVGLSSVYRNTPQDLSFFGDALTQSFSDHNLTLVKVSDPYACPF